MGVITLKVTSEDIEVLNGFAKVLANSDSGFEFVRNLVHSEISGPDIIGAELYFLDSEANLRSVSKYGQVMPFDEDSLSAWADSTPGRAIRSKALENTPPPPAVGPDSSGEGQVAYVLPLFKNESPVGALVTTYLKPTDTAILDPKTYEALSHLGAQFLESSGIGSLASRDQREANPDELTPRQLRVLGYMSEGMTNAEIAKEIMLSESAIRQETVKIYKALGVKSRGEASKKARALGIIPKTVISD
jgi:DNA-binding CsgD family transcriptional regulator